MKRAIQLPFFYRNFGRPPTAKSPMPYAVRSMETVYVEEIDEGAFELAVTHNKYFPDEGEFIKYSMPMFTDGERLYQKAFSNFDRTRILAVDGLMKLTAFTPFGELPKCFQRKEQQELLKLPVFDEERIKPRHFDETNRQDEVEKLKNWVDREVKTHGAYVYDCMEDPTISIAIDDDCLKSTLCRHTKPGFHFPVDCGDQSNEFVNWLSDFTGLDKPTPVQHDETFVDMKIHTLEIPRRTSPVVSTALQFCKSAHLSKSNEMAPFGAHVRAKGLELIESETVSAAIDFVQAFHVSLDDLLRRGYAQQYKNGQWLLDAFEKYLMLLPSHYVVDTDDVISLTNVKPVKNA